MLAYVVPSRSEEEGLGQMLISRYDDPDDFFATPLTERYCDAMKPYEPFYWVSR